jgi:hypothetical protein
MNLRSILLLIVAAALMAACEDTKTRVVEIQLPPPPPPVSTPVVVNVSASQVDGSFLLAGGAFPGSVYQSGDLFFRDQVTGAMVELGDTYDPGYDTMLVHSTYDSVYMHFTGSEVPVNGDGVIASGVSIDAAATVDIDVPLASVRATFTLNGGAFPASVYNHGTFYLQPAGSDELIFLGDSHVANDIVNVMPGSYHVVYSHQQGDQVPANIDARVMSSVAISGNAALNVDVTSVDVRTLFTLNGGAFPQSQYESARFFLLDARGGEVFVGNSFDPAGSISVIADTYDVEYRHQQGDSVPLNKGTIVTSNLDLTGGGAVNVDVTSVTLDINATLNGAPFQVSEQQDGILELYDAASSSYTLLGNTHNPFTGLVVIPGTYDIAYSHETGNEVPQNTRGTVLTGYILAASQQLDLDITAYALTGAITLDAAAFPQSQYNSADFILRGDATSEDIYLFASYAQDEAALVLPGTYDVVYACNNCIEIPFNTGATIVESYDVNANGVVAADLSSVRVEVSALLNGNPFDTSIYQSGLIWGGIGPADQVELTRTNVSTPDIVLLTGDYDFYYQHENGDQVPANVWALVDAQTLSPPPD